MTDAERRGTGRLALLVGLYALQGIPFALINASLPAVLAQRVSDTRIGTLSMAGWPFAFKALLAPWVDAYSSRKGWIVPCTIASGVVWLCISYHVERLIETESTTVLAMAIFFAVLLLAVQDVAVDAWALELLPRRSLPYAPVCQTVGMGIGNLLGHPILLLLSSTHFADPPIVSFEQFLWVLGPVHMILALAVMLQPDGGTAAQRPSLDRIFRQLWQVALLPSTRHIGTLCMLQRLAVAALDGCSLTFYMRLAGARQEHMTFMAACVAPVQLGASVLVARAIAQSELSATDAALVQMRVACRLLLASACFVPAVMVQHTVGSSLSTLLLIIACSTFLVANKLWWTSQGTVFNEAVVNTGGDASVVKASQCVLRRDKMPQNPNPNPDRLAECSIPQCPHCPQPHAPQLALERGQAVAHPRGSCLFGRDRLLGCLRALLRGWPHCTTTHIAPTPAARAFHRTSCCRLGGCRYAPGQISR